MHFAISSRPRNGNSSRTVPPSLFGIGELQGEVDREKKDRYTIGVTATDNGSPQRSASATVVVRVLDANDNAPKFHRSRYQFAVEEGSKDRNQVVGRVEAADADEGDNAKITFRLLSGNDTFAIDENTGEIRSRTGLDREMQGAYELEVTASDSGSPPLTSTVPLAITVTDVNDNGPEFIAPRDERISIREEQPPHTQVTRVQASDPDLGPNGTVTYALEPHDGDVGALSAFEMDPQTGVLRTSVVLSHSERDLYVLEVEARDGGDPPQRSSLTLSILVLNLNDDRIPTSSASLHFQVKEDVEVGTVVGKIGGAESGLNDELVIISGNSDGSFLIDTATGDLVTTKPLDREKTPEYMLRVRNIEGSSSVLVRIVLDDANDNAPRFPEDPIELTVGEAASVGSLVWNLSAEDPDRGLGGEVEYRILAQKPGEAFGLDGRSGRLTLLRPLDHERVREYWLTVEARDREPGSRHFTRATVHIRVEDANDHAPEFRALASVTVTEDEKVGVPLAHLSAVDEDDGENGRLSYEIVSGDERGTFHLDANTGEEMPPFASFRFGRFLSRPPRLSLAGILWLEEPLDRERVSTYRLNASASDHGKPPKTTHRILTVHVEDVNDNHPKFTRKVFQADVLEDAPVGTFVLKVSASDVDSGGRGNLTYLLPKGQGDSKFRMNPQSGEIFTAGQLDRERKDSYSLTVYVEDGSRPSLHDTATILVAVLDINDHAPEFQHSCYALHVPENSQRAVVHTLVAVDRDSGPNGQLSYAISGGNTGNAFSLDPHTGALSVGPLDAETLATYHLLIIAEDRGLPSLRGLCNLTVVVLDENDNAPAFLQPRYHATLREDTPAGTSVLHVKATDPDRGQNARITYSLTNETQWLFTVDNETGLITTTGLFDRERQSVYTFDVRATDGGASNARWTHVQVQVTVADVNDNAPQFERYPFTSEVPSGVTAGQQLLRVIARDPDEGVNALISYRFTGGDHEGKFEMERETGIVRAVRNLAADSARLYQLEVVASDGGANPQSSTGLVEIRVGDVPYVTAVRFTQEIYNVSLQENAPPGTDVIQVSAVRSDGRRQRITYSFGSGNEHNAFEINSNNGLVRVRDSRLLDHEVRPSMRLIVVARTEGTSPLYGYAQVALRLADDNDNDPRFTQVSYATVVWEGNNKGTYVAQVSATDDDSGPNARITYHIADGNVDNAFAIGPAPSGIVKTNIVLDREIRDSYTLTVIATDEGIPQRTGTCSLRINIVDVNDNQPTFPPQSDVTISENSAVGSLVTTITANDVDTDPPLTYDLKNGGEAFAMDRFTGMLTLLRPLDYETESEFHLYVTASDSAHTAETLVRVRVRDENDNAPVFSQHAYIVPIPASIEIGSKVVVVSATDKDSGRNGEVEYFLHPDSTSLGWYVDRRTGAVHVNRTWTAPVFSSVVELLVVAKDKGVPSLSTVVPVHVHVSQQTPGRLRFREPNPVLRLSESSRPGSTVLRLEASDDSDRCCVLYTLGSSEEEMAFEIIGTTGELVLLRPLKATERSNYTLTVFAIDGRDPKNNATASVLIRVEEADDRRLEFRKEHYEMYLAEDSKPGKSLLRLEVPGASGGVEFAITSGNDDDAFRVDPAEGILTLEGALDFETRTRHAVIVSATDGPRSGSTKVIVNVEDRNEFKPAFPTSIYHGFVAENSDMDASVMKMPAVDLDGGPAGVLNYSITGGKDGKYFRIDPSTGIVYTKHVFDYEDTRRYEFTVLAQDVGGFTASASAIVHVDGVDEYRPEFATSLYKFGIPAEVPAGFSVGKVNAEDRDEGPDGVVIYRFASSNPHFKINVSSGDISTKTAVRGLKDAVKLDVVASSGSAGSLQSRAKVEVFVDPSLSPLGVGTADVPPVAGLAPWALALVVALALVAAALAATILFLRIRGKYKKKHESSSETEHHHYDTAFDTLDLRAANPLDPFQIQYGDLPDYESTPGSTLKQHRTSELSEPSHSASASSGRGSAEEGEGEDVEDEEIRMINEGPMRLSVPDSGLHEDDDASDVSAQNTQEYLARLGIDTTRSEVSHTSQHHLDGMHAFAEEGGGDGGQMDISRILVTGGPPSSASASSAQPNRLEGPGGSRSFGQPSMTGSLSSIVHSEEELTGSYNWDYLLDWGPQYQPLANVFSEIARMKDDGSGGGSPAPPPLLTSLAPRTATRTSHTVHHPILPRSPVSHDSTLTAGALSPSFSPALSPLATRSPSISPLGAAPRRPIPSDSELHI
ncbi:unnamed protein product [Darwinula stevensoni]|uniref:Cadherin domain-containing protein n=1 Tax=Darwinula stevensoni TaxID=69355 RepID=A0A7R9A575_9CRUS|nr:unnamed protein product [Darwinula stevensoni]CAG0895058.1 unnamed protein product [Darwinula stevensoni]